ncbi:MAG: MxaK protein [Gammaproteobacteria bacterium]
MRRHTAHLAFGVAVLACAALAGYEGVRLREASRTNEAIARSSATPGAQDVAPLGNLPEAQFAEAAALAKQGRYNVALERYKAVSRGSRADLATDALYNAANLNFREALKEEGPDSAVRMLPLIELAKQSYRSVLRRDPRRWDARYNLERALWLAPELDESLSFSVPRNTEERVMSTLRSTGGDLP